MPSHDERTGAGGAFDSTMSPTASGQERRVSGDPTASLVVTIPMDPPAECNPNARTRVVGYNIIGKPIKKGIHWREKAAAVHAFRAAAYFATADALRGGAMPDGRLRLDATIFWGRNRKRLDDDNAWGSLKSARDGVADALGRNDKEFAMGTLVQTRDKDGAGYVVLTIGAAP
jgi:crossover junction endodeoxyribonuclease RusA